MIKADDSCTAATGQVKRKRTYTPEQEAANREQKRLYYLANKDRIKAKSAKWVKDNPERARASRKQYYENHKEQWLENCKAWAAKNPQKAKASKDKWAAKNKEKRAKSRRKWHLSNPSKVKASAAKYLAKHYEKHRCRIRAYRKKRYKEDLCYRLETNARTRIFSLLKTAKKTARTIELIGCSIAFYKSYIEGLFQQGMTWENWGDRYDPNGWEVDHIIPCASFDMTDPQQQRRCFHYTNTQPLNWLENMKKKDKVPKVHQPVML